MIWNLFRPRERQPEIVQRRMVAALTDLSSEAVSEVFALVARTHNLGVDELVIRATNLTHNSAFGNQTLPDYEVVVRKTSTRERML